MIAVKPRMSNIMLLVRSAQIANPTTPVKQEADLAFCGNCTMKEVVENQW